MLRQPSKLGRGQNKALCPSEGSLQNNSRDVLVRDISIDLELHCHTHTACLCPWNSSCLLKARLFALIQGWLSELWDIYALFSRILHQASYYSCLGNRAL